MKKTIIKILFCAVILSGILFFAEDSKAATINVVGANNQPSCEQIDVQAAINSATTGDTILVPAGNCTWLSSATINKSLTIFGNSTTLTAGVTLNNGFFYVTGFTSSALMRISGFTLNAVNFTAYACNIKVSGVSLAQLRIDNNILYYGYDSVAVGGSKGVIDNNYFYNSLKGISFTAGSRAQANASWGSLDAGTSEALFIENNYFVDNSEYPAPYSQERIGTYNGGKLVIRYNHFNSKDINAVHTSTVTPFMAHGSAAGGCTGGYWQINSSSCRRGQSVIEYYNNTMEGKRIDFMYISRGSANLIYNNSVISSVRYNPRVYLYEEEYFGPSNWPIIRNVWPAEDQVHNTFIWGNTYVSSPTITVVTAPSNANCDGAGVPMICCTGDGIGTCLATDYLQQNRDYFLHAPCGASDLTDAYGNACTHGKAIFTGANGASNTYPTDNITYPSYGTMVFVPTGDNAYYGYTPYTYPHPLRALADNTSPAAPTGLAIN